MANSESDDLKKLMEIAEAGGNTHIDEDAIEQALKNIVSQMADSPDEINNEIPSLKEAEDINSEEKSIDESSTNQNSEVISEDKEIVAKNQDDTEISNIPEENIDDKKEDVVDKSKEILENPNLENEDNKPSNESSKELSKEPSWDELDDSNSVVKKYIVYISKDFVPYIDKMTSDERSAYINDAIQQKIDLLDIKKQKLLKREAIIHTIIAIFAFMISVPIGLLVTNKAIMATFENYKYSQDNFEKLYKQRFEHDRAYMRSVEYNKKIEKQNKAN